MKPSDFDNALKGLLDRYVGERLRLDPDYPRWKAYEDVSENAKMTCDEWYGDNVPESRDG